MRIGRALRSRMGHESGRAAAGRVDSWLEHLFGDRLAAIDAACAGGGPECFALFGDLDVDLWALLLTREYDGYPNIQASCPTSPTRGCRRCGTGAAA
jgi:hypothetical protein